MKKVLELKIGFGVILAILLTLVINAFADGNSINLRNAKGTVGGDPITIEMVVSPQASAIETTISFDPSFLEFVKSASSGTPDSVSFYSIDNTNGSLKVEADFKEGVGEIKIWLVFNALKAGVTYVGIASDSSGNPIEWVADSNGDRIKNMNVYSSEVTIEGNSTPPTETNPPETNPPETDPPQTDPPAPPETDPPYNPSSEARLSSLSFSSGTLSPAFDPDTFTYRLEVASNVSALTASYKTMDNKASAFYWPYIDSEHGGIVYGETEYFVRVTAEDGSTTNDYKVVINRPESSTEPTNPPETEPPHAPSSDARLSALNFSGVGELSPAFDPDTTSYRLTVGEDVTGLDVRYSTKDENATAYFWPWIDGQMHDGEQKTIPYGETVFTIRVTAEDEVTTKDYRITIVRPEPETQPPVETTPEETTPEETTPEETTPEETTPEETTPEETTPEETTEVPTEPAPIVLGSSAVMLKILELPADLEIPAGYTVVQVVGQGGVTYHGLAPEGDPDPDHLILYGVPVTQLPADQTRYEETGETGLYVYDRAQATLQRYGVVVQPTQPETEPTTEVPETTVTEPETTVPPETAAPTKQAPTATAAPSSTAAQTPIGEGGGVPWWVWLGLLILFGICLIAIIGLMISKDKLEKRLTQAERLSADEEEAFLTMNTDTLYNAAKSANPPKRYGMEDIEDLDEVLDPSDGAGKQ